MRTSQCLLEPFDALKHASQTRPIWRGVPLFCTARAWTRCWTLCWSGVVKSALSIFCILLVCNCCGLSRNCVNRMLLWMCLRDVRRIYVINTPISNNSSISLLLCPRSRFGGKSINLNETFNVFLHNSLWHLHNTKYIFTLILWFILTIVGILYSSFIILEMLGVCPQHAMLNRRCAANTTVQFFGRSVSFVCDFRERIHVRSNGRELVECVHVDRVASILYTGLGNPFFTIARLLSRTHMSRLCVYTFTIATPRIRCGSMLLLYALWCECMCECVYA